MGLTGADAALVLLDEMKYLGNGSQAPPDIFTYTTLISGVARAQVSPNYYVLYIHLMTRSVLALVSKLDDYSASGMFKSCTPLPPVCQVSARFSAVVWLELRAKYPRRSSVQDAELARGSGPKSWLRLHDEQCDEGEGVADTPRRTVSSSERCKQLFLEAMMRGVRINGKICNAVMVGFGSDLSVRHSVVGCSSSWHATNVGPTLPNGANVCAWILSTSLHMLPIPAETTPF